MVFCAKPGKAYISLHAETKNYTEDKVKSNLYYKSWHQNKSTFNWFGWIFSIKAKQKLF